MSKFKQRKKPCPACPYVKSTPSGVWAKDEYEKLPPYDGETYEQNATIFQCHHTTDKTSIICQGWLDCHDPDELLGVRLARAMDHLPADFDYCHSGADTYASGREAMENGIRDIGSPSEEATDIMIELSAIKRINALKK